MSEFGLGLCLTTKSGFMEARRGRVDEDDVRLGHGDGERSSDEEDGVVGRLDGSELDSESE